MKTPTPGSWRTGDGYHAHKTTVFNNNGVIARAEDEDDARLIAAAPTMLAVLKSLQWMESGDLIGSSDIECIKEAIALATGETQ